MAIFLIAAIGYPNSDLDFTRPYTICHCEHPKGAWQSNYKRRDCFALLAMTISISEFGGYVINCTALLYKVYSILKSILTM